MGPGRINMKQCAKKSNLKKSRILVMRAAQSFLDSKGNVQYKKRKRKVDKPNSLKKQGKIAWISLKLLNLSRLNKLLLLLIVVCLLVLYANLEHLLRSGNFSYLLSSTISVLNSTKPETKVIEELEAESLKSSMQQLNSLSLKFSTQQSTNQNNKDAVSDYNIFVIYTKENYQLHAKFELFTRSLLKHTTVPLHIHVITDRMSKASIEDILRQQMKRFGRSVTYTLYDVQACAELIVDIVSTMRPYFSATPKSYYSDALFFLSLGLHRIADAHLDRVVLLDCDIVFRADIRQLFSEFNQFSEENLFGLAPELTPVYRHILYRYRVSYPGTNFGNPYYPMRLQRLSGPFTDRSESLEEKVRLNRRIKHGYPGLNSGVVLLRLQRIRSSQLYNEQIMPVEVQRLTSKYSFRGHLGDQDFFTLLGYEYPHLIYRLDCVWNRQLCTWWKNHGYSEVFDTYFHCERRIRMYHGNCNTRVPE